MLSIEVINRRVKSRLFVEEIDVAINHIARAKTGFESDIVSSRRRPSRGA